LLVLASLLWGATFVAIRDVVARVDPAALVFARFAIAGLLLVPYAWARRGFGTGALAGGALSGLLGALGFVFQAAGLRETTPGTSAFITATGSLFAGVFAWPLLGQRPGLPLALGIGVAVVGAALLTPPTGWGGSAGEALTALGAIAFGLQIVALARFAPGADPVALSAVQAVVLAAAVAPFGVPRLPQAPLDPRLAGELAYLIVAGSIVAPLCQVIAQRSLGAGRVGLLLGLEPVFAVLFAIAFAAERPTPMWWLGAALILLAVTFVERDAARALGASHRPPT
jgi:drug/metabolite transporter (DMT)-like permease